VRFSVGAVAVVAAIGIAYAASVPSIPGAPRAAVTPVLTAHAHGSLRIRNSLGGKPIVTADTIVPGQSRGGRVRIRNRGTQPVRLALARRRMAEAPGPNGGAPSGVVRVKLKRYVRSGNRRHSGKVMAYQGRLAKMPRVDLGRLSAHRRHRYRLSLGMPDGGIPPSPTTGDNAYQGSTLSVDFVWLARRSR
jgi:hypothetical protein